MGTTTLRARLPLLVLLALLAGCSERERLNPFDPANPITGGRPSGFVAEASDGVVALRWNTANGDQLIGFRAYRRGPGEPDFAPLTDVMPLRTTRFDDRGVTNGSDYEYRLHFVFSAGLGPRFAQDAATPGITRPWVADAGAGTLMRLTPDGRKVAFRSLGLSAPVAVAVDTTDGTVWVSDDLSGRVRILRGNGTSLDILGFSQPGAIAVQHADHTAWICDERRDQVDHLQLDGNDASPPIGPLQLPLGVAVDVGDSAILIVERTGGRVRRHARDGTLIWTQPVAAPSRVAADPLTHEAWVTSFENGRLIRLSPSGAVLETVSNLGGPIGVAFDPRRGRVWVAEAAAGRVTAFDGDGDHEFSVAGLPAVRDVSVDAETGDGWAAVTDAGEIVRISPAGAITRRLGGFSIPYGIAIDPGVRPF
jgi:DNA-binding beta-propeller fold protein YncE